MGVMMFLRILPIANVTDKQSIEVKKKYFSLKLIDDRTFFLFASNAYRSFFVFFFFKPFPTFLVIWGAVLGPNSRDVEGRQSGGSSSEDGTR